MIFEAALCIVINVSIKLHLTRGGLSLVGKSFRNCVWISLRSVGVSGGCPSKWTSLPTWLSELVRLCSQTLVDNLGRTVWRRSLMEPLGEEWERFLTWPARWLLPLKTSRCGWTEVRPHEGAGKRSRGGKRWRGGRGEQMLPTRSQCGISGRLELV